MKIGAIQKTSLLDYPGKIAAIIGTQGCNMRCPWCHNYFLIPYDATKHSADIPEKEFLNFLSQRKNFLEGLVVTGGEPTIQEDLPEFCDEVKGMGFTVKLDTNGTHPGVLNRLLKNALIDYIAMDVKTDFGQYERLFREKIDTDAIRESIELVMSADIPYEFRITCISPFVTVKNIDKIGHLIQGAQKLFLQKCIRPQGKYADQHYDILDENQLGELKQKAQSHVLSCEIRRG